MTAASAIEAKATQRELTLSDVIELARLARISTAERDALAALDRDFEKRVAPQVPRDGQSFRKALFAWLLGRREEASAALSRFRGNPLASFVLGRIAEEALDPRQAVEHFRAAASGLEGEPRVQLALAGALCAAGEHEKAAAELDKVEKSNPGDPWVRAELAFQRGYLRELAGDQEGALDLYENALVADGTHAGAAFRMARILDLRGEDDRAMELYGRCVAGPVRQTGPMVNLALLYEDRGDCERAIAYYRDVLRADPSNRRVRLFLRGAVESTEEVYDEVERKEREKLEQVLRTPVSEFELSVRSRNVLAKMNIKTLGDLVQKTENEMLAYRNFGETSLREIKQLLASKGLRLGMARDEVERRHKRERLALVMSDRDSRVLSTPVAELGLSVRSRRCMARLNIQTVGDLIARTADELLSIKNFGQVSLNEVRTKLAELGLSLRAASPGPEAEKPRTKGA